jgi:tetratricopeptide repeat protein 30
LHSFPDSTAIYSIIAYCYWKLDEFRKAADCDQKLISLNPSNDSYKLHYAHCLYKCEKYFEANRNTFGIQSSEYKTQGILLQAAVNYAQEENQSTKSILTAQDQTKFEIMMDTACVF